MREQTAWGGAIEIALFSRLRSVLVKVFVRASDGSDPGYLEFRYISNPEFRLNWHYGCTSGDAASAIRLLYDGSHCSNIEPEVAFTDVVPPPVGALE